MNRKRRDGTRALSLNTETLTSTVHRVLDELHRESRQKLFVTRVHAAS
jgi:hypothetical protein